MKFHILFSLKNSNKKVKMLPAADKCFKGLVLILVVQLPICLCFLLFTNCFVLFTKIIVIVFLARVHHGIGIWDQKGGRHL